MPNRFSKQNIPKEWDTLTPRQKALKKIALDVLSQTRRTGNSLSKVAKEHGTTIRTVNRYTDTFRKIKGGWVPQKSDRIARPPMTIYEKGEEVAIQPLNSKEASKIGEYFNAVKTLLDTGKTSVLSSFKNVKIKDNKGVQHTLEVNPRKIRDIEDRREDPEFFTVYNV